MSEKWEPPQTFDEIFDEVKHRIQGPIDVEFAAVYVRKSQLDSNAEDYSMEIQPDRAEEYVNSHGWATYRIYSDPDYSGKNSRRPELQRMLRDIESGKITVVVVHRLDRLYRNLESLLRFIRKAKKYNVRLVSVTEQIDTESAWGRLVLYILGALAEMWIIQTSERVREFKEARVKKNHLPNGSYRFGYCNGQCSACTDPNGKGYCVWYGGPDRPESERGRIQVPHPVESHAVRLIFHLYGRGWSDLEIATYLNTNLFQLPDESEVRFRTKGILNLFPPGDFKRDSVRNIVKNPFYAGWLAVYPSDPLDMEDDLDGHAKRKNNRTQKQSGQDKQTETPISNRREPQSMHHGEHKAIISIELWQRCQQIRRGKGRTPTTRRKPARTYQLSGSGKCWICYEYDKRIVGLRGSTNNNGCDNYRCATEHDSYAKKRKLAKSERDGMPDLDIRATLENDAELLRMHHTLRADLSHESVNRIMSGLKIPTAWYEMIMAYYISDDGMSAFEWKSYNLEKELKRLHDLYLKDRLTSAAFEEKATFVERKLKALKPSASPEAAEILPLLADFATLWEKLETIEKCNIQKIISSGFFFDGESKIRKSMIHSPFDRLLEI